LREIEKLMLDTDTSTKKDLINNAITLLKWAVRQRQQGRVLCSYSESGGILRELEMPILQRVAPEGGQEGVNTG